MNKCISFFKEHNKITLWVMSIILGFITILFASTVSSFLYSDFSMGQYVWDSNFFYLLGHFFSLGKTPYIEVFDHKGLYMFYYTGLGAFLGGRVAFYFIQSIFMTVTYYFIIKSMKELNVHKSLAVVSLLIFLGFYTLSINSPSDSEPQLPFIAATLYLYIKAVTTKEDKYFIFGNILAGVCAGIAFNIRASDAMVAVGFVIAFLVYSIRYKKWKGLLINALVSIGAFILTCLPAILHAYFGGFLNEMIQATLLDNFAYVGNSGDRSSINPWLCRIAIVAIAALFYVPLILNRKKLLENELMIFGIATGVIFFIQLIVAFYMHYLFIMFPLLFVYIPRGLSLFFNEEKKWFLIGKLTALGFAIATSLVYPIRFYLTEVDLNKELIKEVEMFVPLDARQNGQVLCVDTYNGLYFNTSIVPSYGDFAIQRNHIEISKYYHYETYIEYLTSGKCKYVITLKDADVNGYRSTTWFKTAEGTTYYEKVISSDLKLLDIYIYR